MTLFSARIQDRRKRWWVNGEDHEFKHIAEKIQGQKFVESLGLSVPERYFVGERIESIPEFVDLPEKFVIKPSRGWSSNNVFVLNKGRNMLDGKKWSRNEIVAFISSQPSVNENAKTKLMIEEYLVHWSEKNKIANDYKFFMFGSEIAYVSIIERNDAKKMKSNRFWNVNEDWELIDFQVMKSQVPENHLPKKPDCWDELCEMAREIGSKLNMFMRVDLYATSRGPVFGEFTPQPHGGKGFTTVADQWLGSLWCGKEGADNLPHQLD